MNKNNFANFGFDDQHPTGDALLMLVDGELSPRDAVVTREHLETCWNCRGELEKIEETISLFVEFRRKVETPLSATPPNNWGGFVRLLAVMGNDAAGRTPGWFSFLDLSPFQLRIGIASMSALLIAAILWQLVAVGQVSAGELLDRAIIAQEVRDSAEPKPVVYQKVRIRSGNGSETEVELWNDRNNRRFKKTVSDNAPRTASTSFAEVTDILQANGMDPNDPLSIEGFKNWRAALSDKVDEVRQNDTISLTTTNRAIALDGQIGEATLRFRGSDLHPIGKTLKVKAPGGEKLIEIVEVGFEVANLNTFSPGLFDDVQTSIVADTRASPTMSSEADTIAANVSERTDTVQAAVETNTSTATPELEIEVLELLNKAGADLGEEITVSRENGTLYVRGMVDSAARKTEVLAALASVARDPAVKIRLSTIAEAVAAKNNGRPGLPTSVETLETKTLTTAAENDLVRHFGGEAEARRFASSMVDRSGRAMNHIYALRRLVRQFSPADAGKLGPEARAKWLSLIGSHARAFRNESATLARGLAGVFAPAGGSASVGAEVDGVEDLLRAADDLFSLASANDRNVRASLTISPDEGKISVLRTPGFWRSLRRAEALADRITSIR